MSGKKSQAEGERGNAAADLGPSIPAGFNLLDLITNMPDPRKDPYGPGAWKEIAPASIRGHIAREHFDALHLAKEGVARWDLEMAATRGGRRAGFDMDWVVTKAIALLRRPDADIQSEIERFGVENALSPDTYRSVLVKNLLYIDRLGLSNVDWAIVEEAYPGFNEVTLDIERDGDERFPHYVESHS